MTSSVELDTYTRTDEKQQHPEKEQQPEKGQTQASAISADDYKNEEILVELSDEVQTDEFTCSSCCKSFFRRNWMLIFFGTLLGFDIGFWVYLSTGYPQWMGACVLVSFIVTFIIDEYLFASRRTTDSNGWKYAPDPERVKKFEMIEDCDIYLQTDIFSRFCRIYRGGSRVYRKNNSGSLVFQRMFVYFIEDYGGYEMGAGFFSLLVIPIFFIIAAFIDSNTNILLLLTQILIFIFSFAFYFSIIYLISWLPIFRRIVIGGKIIALVAFAVFAFVYLIVLIITNFIRFIILLSVILFCGIVGGLLEWCLRKNNVISPLVESVTLTTSVPMHEIRDLQSETIGYYTICTNRVKEQLGNWYYLVLWIRFLQRVGKFFVYIGKLICINAPFFLWLLVFIFTALVFLLVVNKGSKALLQFIIVGILIIFVLHILFLLFLHTPFCGCGDNVRIGNSCKLRKYSILRIPASTQTLIFYGLLISCIAVFIAAGVLAVINEQIYETAQDIFTDFKKYDVIVDKLKCNMVRRRLLTGSLTEELCNSPRKELLIVAVICMCLSWNILLLLAFWWYMVDQYFVLCKSAQIKKVWNKYTRMRITRAYVGKFQMLSPTIDIELNEEQAIVLMSYLADVCPYTQLPTTMGVSYDGGLQYVNRFGAIGGHPFGNGVAWQR